MTLWTEEEDEALRDGARDGLSYADVAARLPGRNRDMVAGRAGRLGVAFPMTARKRETMAMQGRRGGGASGAAWRARARRKGAQGPARSGSARS